MKELKVSKGIEEDGTRALEHLERLRVGGGEEGKDADPRMTTKSELFLCLRKGSL